jgi:6-pyruvoyl-tetrahydropterin synthase
MSTRTLHVERSTSTAHRLQEYDGVCGNIHGHNMDWDVTVTVSMEGTGQGNMPLDLKEVADLIDEVDHTCILSTDDQLVRLFEDLSGPGTHSAKTLIENHFGDVIWFGSDPTCEVVAEWMAEKICELDPVLSVEVTLHETEKYGIGYSHESER